MTTTSAGTPRFHLKPVITVLAATAIVAATIVVAQQIGRDTTPAPAEVATAAVVPAATAAANGLVQALADGKLDAGFVAAQSQTATNSVPVAETVTIFGQGALIDALIDGKFTSDWHDPGVRYVSGGDAPSIAGGLWAALESGKLDAGLTDGEQTPPPVATHTPTLSGGHQS